MSEVKQQVSFAQPQSNEVKDVREKLEGRILRRKASFSPAEAFFLHGLLIDDDTDQVSGNGNGRGNELEEEKERLLGLKQAVKVLDDEVLFSVPESLVKRRASSSAKEPVVAANLPRRPSRILDLWLAHEEGVAPKSLVKRGSLVLKKPFQLGDLTADSLPQKSAGDEDDIASDDSVRDDKRDDDDVSECSSWDDDEHKEHYSAWEILKDEYAEDFGFDYTTQGTVADILNDTDINVFKILGTSADDKSSQPHVLSPPLMDSLMSFLPDNLVNENYWLKFSLVRDGASLETLKQYCRASSYTIIAIETRKGDVFGCFTSHPWRNHFGFYGSAPSFVWKMRHSRKTKCHSLFDQAQLESEIDVFMFTSLSTELLQVCRHDALALGGDSTVPNLDDFDDLHAAVKATEKMGFAIALEDDLMIGTTSPSPTFSSPSLCGVGDRTETFEVMNLEVWTFTPCSDVPSAERLEMSKFFIEESTRTMSTPNSSLRSGNSPPNSPFSGRDLDQERFYRRVGQDPESEERRQRWQYLNMMNPAEKRGIGASPRFS